MECRLQIMIAAMCPLTALVSPVLHHRMGHVHILYMGYVPIVLVPSGHDIVLLTDLP
jgi:hypothetical protein